MSRRHFLYSQFGVRGPGWGHRYYYYSNPLEQLQAQRPIRPYLLGLFSGIGGFERGFHSAGHTTKALSEKDPYASEVLSARFPDVPNLGQIETIIATPRDVEVICAGWPCKDISQAGGQHGLYQGGESSLIFEVLRLLQDRRTPVVVLENVKAMLSLKKGQAMNSLMTLFEDLGYSWAYRLVDARSFGYPQRRERVMWVFSNDPSIDPRNVLLVDNAPEPEIAVLERKRKLPLEEWRTRALSFSLNEGRKGAGWALGVVGPVRVGSKLKVIIPSPPVILMPSGDIIKPDIRDVEMLQGFPSGWTVPAQRVGASERKTVGERWKMLGNALPVRIASWIGERLVKPGDYDWEKDRKAVNPKKWPHAAWGIPGQGRWVAQGVTDWPFEMDIPNIQDALRYPGELASARAVKGFLKRLRQGTLRRPASFERALEKHIKRMGG